MKEGLYKKYIVTFALTLLMCTALLGVALLYFSAQNFTEEKEQNLRSTAELARDTISKYAYADKEGKLAFKPGAGNALSGFAESAGVTAFAVDSSGAVALCSEKDCSHDTPVGERLLRAADERGFYVGANVFSGHGGYMVGVPFDARGAHAYVFVTSPIAPLYAFLADLMFTFLVSSGVMLVASAFIIYFATRQLAEPLAEISAAADRFGKGDFTARVEIEGRDEVAHLANSFNEMADSLCEFEQNRRGFVANVSHELRTPMTTIGGYVDGILDGTIPPEKQSYYLGIVSSEVKRLARLSSSLLDVSRIEADEYTANLVSVNAWDVMLSVLFSAEQRIADKKIKISDMEVATRNVMCDSDMLYQIIYNLVDNAIKFTPELGEITVSIEPTGDGTQTAIKIRNTGAGIPEQDISRIFGRFYKTDKSRSLDRTGTGLGLYIVRSLVKKMDGRLSATSVEGQWTEFCVELRSGEKSEKKDRAKPQRVVFPSSGDKSAAKNAGKGEESAKRRFPKLFDGFKKK